MGYTVHGVAKESDRTEQLTLCLTFLPKSKHLLFSWLQSPYAVILEPKKIKSVTASSFPPFYLA